MPPRQRLSAPTCRAEFSVSYLSEIAFTSKEIAMRYAVVIEKAETGFGAYVPDLPDCVAAGATRDEVIQLIQEAIEFHIEGLKNDGQPVPEPASSVAFVDVAA